MDSIWQKMKQIYSGPLRRDCCSHNIYEAIAPITVKEFCEYILTTNEWGYIGIKDGNSVFGNPRIEYIDHQYVDEKRNPIKMNWPEHILNSYVTKLDWDGGWSRGDWLFTIKRR